MERYKRPDKKNALSIVEAAERDMKYTLSLPSKKEGGATIIRNVYECFRMLGDAILVNKGIKSEDHVTQINELKKLKLSLNRPISLLENLRVLRHIINYYGYTPKIEEVEEITSFAKSCFDAILKATKKEIKKNEIL